MRAEISSCPDAFLGLRFLFIIFLISFGENELTPSPFSQLDIWYVTKSLG